ncbi:hypothetical protein [Dyadobacter sp. CY326]|nr:hypothetical protein [Dyadobacter sp. CY326]MCE7065941.1 hypothetical protein [Dyadobacter sp. CY326]
MGLENTVLRLEQAYGEKAKLIFDQPAEGGTIVTLHINGQPKNKITK